MKTRLFTVNAVGSPEPIIVQTVCRHIEIGEDPSNSGFPTTDYKVRKPTADDDPRQVPVGAVYAQFDRLGPKAWQPGEIAGYVETVQGSASFYQDESQ